MKKLPPYNNKTIEEDTLTFWQDRDIFKKSLKQRQNATRYTFYDGPPFANGLPHYGHLVTSVIKDAIPRLKTMQGHYVPRRFGWDCHGLPAEMEAEKQLGVTGKVDIIDYGIDKFNAFCRQSVLRYTKEWQGYVTRLGRWVDFDDDYRTMDPAYMDSVIWVFGQLWDKDLIYEGHKVLPYCYICETSLSNFETRLDDATREREDQTVTVEFKLADDRNLLVWTTTPWTLPSNLALAINPDITYVELELDGKIYVLAESAQERYSDRFVSAKSKRKFVGKELAGLRYTPLFDYFTSSANAFVVLAADFVNTEEGTGVVHIAPGFGEDDQIVAAKAGIDVVCPVDSRGRFTSEVSDYTGELVFDTNKSIIDRLTNMGQLFASELYRHNYPHCWRTDNPLIYRAQTSWFVDVTKIKQKLLNNNQQIDWIPENVKDGSFGNWLKNARDWNISRNRFWGAPLPIWRNQDGDTILVRSLAELKDLAENPAKVTDWHRPAIDEVIIKHGGKIYKRVEDVLDCWFESGAMPYAQDNFPFSINEESFKKQFPADFITEYNGQVRGWFYTLHVLATALFNQPAFKTCISHGIILGTDGRKMSKRLGNYPALEDVFDTFGSDSLRYYLLTSPVINGETVALDEEAIRSVQRNLFMTLYNSAGFWTMYAQIDGFKPKSLNQPEKLKNRLDLWLVSRVKQIGLDMEAALVDYDLPSATRPILELVDDLSNWYIRRSRRRFWKSSDDSDKQQAYQTLFWALIKICQLLAPWSPFASDYIYRHLTDGMSGVAESVHLCDWPKFEAKTVDKQLLEQMVLLREIVSEGLAQRAAAGVRVRQPLGSVKIIVARALDKELQEIIADELNVKKVDFLVDQKGDARTLVKLNTKITHILKMEGFVRDLIRHIQTSRKEAGLNVEDRIRLSLVVASQFASTAILAHKELIMSEVLATELDFKDNKKDYQKDIKLDGEDITIQLQKN